MFSISFHWVVMNSNEGKSDRPIEIHTEYYHEGGSLPIQERHMFSSVVRQRGVLLLVYALYDCVES